MQLLSELKNIIDIHVHPNITFYLFLLLIFISIFITLAFYFKLFQTIACKRIFLPTSTNEIELTTAPLMHYF
jgi:hypothetical protein